MFAKEVSDFKRENIKTEQIIFDPGIGFGKNALQSIGILKNIDAYKGLGLPLYIGHSKKSFLKEIDFCEELDVGEKTLIISEYLITKGVDFLRVHDVRETLGLLNKTRSKSLSP